MESLPIEGTNRLVVSR